MPRGGARTGSGRKAQPFRCAADGCEATVRRRDRLRSKYCSAECVSRMLSRLRAGCPKFGSRIVKGTKRPCQECRTEFRPRYATHVFCSMACSAAWARRTRGNSHRSDRLRASRRASSARRRAAVAKTGRITVGRWRSICERDGWVCWICRTGIDCSLCHPNKKAGTCDHVVPLSLGGSDSDENVRAAHASCNSRRGAAKFQPQEAV
jgi:hypothetical protein